ncbi:iron-containing alcohol dehydrogenase [Oxyplasma meridianum]|uniref:Iron-containing alcohol dehydrogenase n=1 Tax=Oxyplasma meridianum TaxID=3073602 RepID=A0AAX4NFV3_9ARCH
MEFNYLPLRKVFYGNGSIENLDSIISENGMKHPLVVASHSVSMTTFYQDMIDSIKTPFTEFAQITQHSPLEEIEHGVESMRNKNCDSIISIGGGSVIDASKVIRYYYNMNAVQVAIPTTLSAAEFSHIAGYTIGGEKTGIRDKGITPQYVILDPAATAETPDILWKSTGIRSLDHALETIVTNNFSEPAVMFAMKAIEKLMTNLEKSGLDARLECQKAAWYSYFEVFDAPMGLSHNIGKIIGAKWGIPHGITSCITLPAVMRYYAGNNPEPLAEISRQLGIGGLNPSDQAYKTADMVENFIRRIGLTRKLSDYYIKDDDLDYIVSKLKGNREELMPLIQSML